MDTASRSEEYPLVTIVTPSYNAASFIEETIESVLCQDYPNIEYLVLDGGSSDGTLAILHRYDGRLRYISRPDKGQASAINQGFAMSHGEIFTFLNADDTYLPGAIRAAVHALQENPEAAVVYGDAYWVDKAGNLIGPYPTKSFDPQLFRRSCYICQPASFMRAGVFRDVGGMNESLHFGLDYDLWIRISKRCRMLKIDQFLANSRMHDENKTLGKRRRAFREYIEIAQAHYDYAHFDMVYGYCRSLWDRQDLFFQPVRPSRVKFAASLVLGSYLNRTHLLKFWRECTGEIVAGLRKL